MENDAAMQDGPTAADLSASVTALHLASALHERYPNAPSPAPARPSARSLHVQYSIITARWASSKLPRFSILSRLSLFFFMSGNSHFSLSH